MAVTQRLGASKRDARADDPRGIVADKSEEVVAAQVAHPLAAVEQAARGVRAALTALFGRRL